MYLKNLKNAFILMRIPFSIYLMPVYWFAVSQSFNIDLYMAVYVFLIIHLLVYPASNGYNSYFDRDEQSIGGLKTPPKVTKELLYVVLLFDTAAIVCSFVLSNPFGWMVTAYLLISKAYSNPHTRLKKYAILSTVVIFIFQGAFTFFMVQKGIGMNNGSIINKQNILFALVSSFFLLGSYPITQLYQHEEDAKHGDKTLSMMLGIKGTFIFSGIIFAIATMLLCSLYYSKHNNINILVFLIAMVPVMFFFQRWINKVNENSNMANFENTMLMNKVSSISLSLAFIIMLFLN
jgi:4-hydroxybenzoate polyprenyltransferase